jgi:hypothetical protein
MLTRLKSAAVFCGLAIACSGCCGAMQCGDGCAKGSPYAFMKYDCECETCGPGFCTSCGNADCTCGSKVECGDKCTCGGGCADGCCGGFGGRIGPCGDRCDGGCTSCGRRSPCCILNWLCACSGCGEFYWNEWYNDPPRCAEPCDCFGNWIGPGHGGYFRAPYRSHHGYAAAESPATAPPPLETADAAATYNDGDLDAQLQ